MSSRVPATTSNPRLDGLWALLLLLGCGADPSAGSGSGDTGTTSGAEVTSAFTTTVDSGSTVGMDASGSGGASSDGTHGTTSDPGTGTGGPQPDDCITDTSAGHHAFECDGLTYDLEVPPQCLAGGCGLIVDVHGFTMSAQMQDANTDMRARGLEHDFIVLQPNANPAPPLASWNPATDDDKVFAFLQRVATVFAVDPDRIHFTGFSQGGFMSWRFACAHADVLASVAPGAACGNGGGAFPDCVFDDANAPSEPLDVLYLHGTTDALVNIACAQPRIDAVVEHFGLGPAMPVEQDDGHRWIRHASDEMVLEYIEHDYAAGSPLILGHCFPGSTDPGDATGQVFSFACEGDNAFVWGEAVMDFFLAHPK